VGVKEGAVAATFTDGMGTVWALSIAVPHLKPLKGFGLDLGKAGRSGKDLAEAIAAAFEAEPANLVSCLWELCAPQAEKLGLTPEQFGIRFDGPTLWAAVEALGEAVINFSQRPQTAPGTRANLTRLLKKLDAENEKRLRAAAARIEALPLETLTESATSNGTATNSPDSSASTPDA
jgi:hypothetical protein